MSKRDARRCYNVAVIDTQSPLPVCGLSVSFRRAGLCTALWCVIALAAVPAATAGLFPDKSPNDPRQYEVIMLPNHLRAVLVSDPTTDKAAASMDVNVGAFNDPADREGMAHFLEHMLFLGTEKYPDPGAYPAFIQSHGGRYNASTTAEHTNFYFEVNPEALQASLDRFAQFFTAPLFDAAYVDRERNAVDAEYRMRIRDDARRIWQIGKATANDAHPFSHFTVGSLETLAAGDGDSLRAELLRFYKSNYSSNRMTLAVLGRQSLAELERLVTDHFGAIPDRNLPPFDIEVPLYTPDQLKIRIDVVPIEDQRQLELAFPYPWQADYYLNKPMALLGYLLGHEGEDTLYALLKAKGWIKGIYAGTGNVAGNTAVFTLDFDLTPEGERHTEEITTDTFEYIRLIAARGISKSIYTEMQRMRALEFEYQEPGAPGEAVRALALNLQQFPAAEVISGPYHLGPFDEDNIRSLLQYLTPDNLRVMRIAPDLATDRRERWYDTPYRVEPLAADQLRGWRTVGSSDRLAIPGPNPFIPSEARLKPLAHPTAVPEQLIDRPGLTLWYKQDDTFRVPRADVFVKIHTPLANDTPRHAALSSLLVAVADDLLDEYSYPAALAGLNYSINRTNTGIGISLSGYDEKLPLLLRRITERLTTLPIDPQRFEVLHQKLLRQWRNNLLDTPYRRLNRELNTVLYEHLWSVDVMLDAAEDLSPDDLARFVPQLFKSTHIEILAHGNLLRNEAKSLATDVADAFLRLGKAGNPVYPEVTHLARGEDLAGDVAVAHRDRAALIYYQAADDDIRTQAAFALLQEMMQTPFFNELRTREQLGYLVYMTSASALRLPGIKFVIQSPDTPRPVLVARIQRFLEDYAAQLETMDPAVLEQFRLSLASRLTAKDTQLRARSLRYLHDLSLNHLRFDSNERLAEAVTRSEKATVLATLRSLLPGQSPRRIQLVSDDRLDETLTKSKTQGIQSKPVSDAAALGL